MVLKENAVREKNVKIPLYVSAYETISGWLKAGKYKPGDKLPGENVLAEQLQVSRGTLRQAMLLLQEDGLIANHQGKGSIVLSNQDMTKNGLEKIGNPLTDFCKHPIVRAETVIGFQPATQKYQKVLKLRPSGLLAVVDITYYSQDGPVGFAMIYMPYGVLDQATVDLEDTETVCRFYNELVNNGGLFTDSRIRIGQARERTAGILNIEEGASILIMEEELYSEFDTPVLSQKLFFSPGHYDLCIRRRNDRK